MRRPLLPEKMMSCSARLAPLVGAFLFSIFLAASAQDAFTTRTVNIRAGPDTSYPTVAVLGAGAPVQVVGCLDDWSWCDVVFGDNRGWAYSPYLSYVYQGYRVPFYSYAPSFGIPIISFSLGSYWDRYYRGRPWYGRRDYWERRQPVHVRPSGAPPRASLPSQFHEGRFPENRDNRNYRDYRGNEVYRNREANRPAPQGAPVEGRRPYAGPPGGQPPSGNRGAERAVAAPPRSGNPPPQTVERVQRAGPPPSRGGEQRAGPPPSRGGEQRAERPAKEGGERKEREEKR